MTQDTQRGAALVDEVVARAPVPKPRPLAAAAIARLTLDGDPLPPSLARWLAYDASWLDLDGEDPELPALSIVELAEDRFPELGEAFVPFEELLPGKCFALPLANAEEQTAFLYVGKPDAQGEYPVFVIDIDDEPAIALAAPGFDVHVARQFGVIQQRAYYGDLAHVAPSLVAALEWHAENNFGGEQVVAVGALDE
jgi:hypothetical protein